MSDHGINKDTAHDSVSKPQEATSQSVSLSYEELHRKARDVLPLCFEGAKFVVAKGLSTHFQITHTLLLSQSLTGYRFGATFVGDNSAQNSNEAYPVLLGELDFQGNSSATLVHQINKIRIKCQSQIQQNQFLGTHLSAEHRGRLSTFGVTFVNPNLINNSGIFIAQYLRRITDKFDLGAEYVCQRDPKLPGNQISALTYAARYTTPIFTLAANLASSAVHLSYHHKQTDYLQFAVDMEANLRQQEAVTTFGYQVEIPETFVLRASLDTTWTVGATLEKKLSRQMPFTFVISGLFNHVKLQSRFGVGLSLG